ncbi:FAD-binding oxidoreductase [Streptomyces sp. NPDC048057]|uniref:FAD-binding oxidoreductase n=1 Tax=Streptomyces sp. NPDC048057 TaxID=3155628 RepID=UPI0033F5B17C
MEHMNDIQQVARVVHTPADPGYEEEASGFQTGFRQRPELVVGAADADEVRRAVTYAAGRGLSVSVQATGHGMPGAREGGLLITTHRMDEVHIDPAARTARIGAGVRWAQVVAAASPHGLAPLSGSSPGVGAVSYVLGGGIGLLGRRFGYASDHVRALEVVTADGALRRLTPEGPDGDLWRALLGGGNVVRLGVVTAMEIDLFPVSLLYGGYLRYGEESVEAAVRAYLEWTRGVPDEMASGFAVMVYPDAPGLPEHLRGRYVASVSVAYAGDAAAGARLVAPLRAAAPVVEDTLRELPYAENATVYAEPDQPHAYYGDNAMVRDLDADTAVRVLKATGPGQPVWSVTQISHLGGALARGAAGGGGPDSVPYRSAAYAVRMLSALTPEVDVPRVRALHREAFALLGEQVLGRAANFSFGGGDELSGLHDAEIAARLSLTKRRYDAGDVF